MKRFTTLMIILISVFSLVGCDQTADSDRPISACIDDYVTKVNITHHISGKSTQWVAEGQDIDNLRAWASELEYKLFKFEEGQSPGDGDGGEVYDFILTGGDYPGFSYVINGPDDCYLLIEGYWYSVSNPSDPPVTEPPEEKLTLEKVKKLAKKGEALSWSDFEQFRDGGDIGSGLYILAYDIDENYRLLIGGADKQTSPMYIYLQYKADDSRYIDIRTESIDDFTDNLND